MWYLSQHLAFLFAILGRFRECGGYGDNIRAVDGVICPIPSHPGYSAFYTGYGRMKLWIEYCYYLLFLVII